MSGLFQYFLAFSFSSVHYHATGIWRNGLKCKSSQWWASTQPPTKLYLSHRQACCHVASSQYYNLCFTSMSLISLPLFAGHVCFCAYRQEPQLYSQDNFWKNIKFFTVSIKIYKELKIFYYAFSNPSVMKQKIILNSSILSSQLHKYNY